LHIAVFLEDRQHLRQVFKLLLAVGTPACPIGNQGVLTILDFNLGRVAFFVGKLVVGQLFSDEGVGGVVIALDALFGSSGSRGAQQSGQQDQADAQQAERTAKRSIGGHKGHPSFCFMLP